MTTEEKPKLTEEERDKVDIETWNRQIALNHAISKGHIGMRGNAYQEVDFKPAEWCWGDSFWKDGTPHACGNKAVTEIGLCKSHYQEIVDEDYDSDTARRDSELDSVD